jgi:hypothetical protein
VSNSKSDKVTEYMDRLVHARKPEVEQLRNAILSAGVALTEQIKWNAPSFCVDGEDRVTMRLQPGDRVELVFHRGAKKRVDAFEFTDTTGLIRWRTPDRGIVELADAQATRDHLSDVVSLVEAWMRSTVTNNNR